MPGSAGYAAGNDLRRSAVPNAGKEVRLQRDALRWLADALELPPAFKFAFVREPCPVDLGEGGPQ